MTFYMEATLFAEYLMKYIFEKFGLKYIARCKCETGRLRKDIVASPFRIVIGDAVYTGIDNNLYELSVMFHEEFETTFDTLTFKERMMKLVPNWFPEGYHPICFIEFCIMVSSTAITYHRAGYHEIPSCAGEVIATVLTKQMIKGEFNPKNSWEKLVKASTELVILHRQTSYLLG